jgi:hypothetical protein
LIYIFPIDYIEMGYICLGEPTKSIPGSKRYPFKIGPSSNSIGFKVEEHAKWIHPVGNHQMQVILIVEDDLLVCV